MNAKNLLIFSLLLFSATAVAQENNRSNFNWKSIEPGLKATKLIVPAKDEVLKSEVLLLQSDPKFFSFDVALANDLNETVSDMKRLGEFHKAVAAINSNFFTPKLRPLGVVIRKGELLNRKHLGGGLLTGIFLIKNDKPEIIERTDFDKAEVETAAQAGPLLITKGVKRKLRSKLGPSRRSGIAITNDEKVILVTTIRRGPGATVEHIQELLSDPNLNIRDALSFDGGGSSQLYVQPLSGVTDKELLPLGPNRTFITGGDKVPVGLTVKRK